MGLSAEGLLAGVSMMRKKFKDKRTQNCELTGSNNKCNIGFGKDLYNDYLGSVLVKGHCNFTNV